MIRTLSAVLIAALAGPSLAQPIERIAFGSCAREDRDQEIWDEIVAVDPDIFLFIGDNVYVDIYPDPENPGETTMAPPPDVSYFHSDYAMLAAKPGWRALNETCPVLTTWDDHDFGVNDGGKEWRLKEESQEIYLDFYGVEDPERRSREGVYHAEIHGTPGRRVQFIMLDTRYHRDPLTQNPAGRPRGLGPYVPNPWGEGTMLGDAQWRWLAGELRKPAEVRVIASSIQVVADEHGWETWGNMPHERRRLYDLIEATGAEGVVFVTGDRHLIEISRDTREGAPYPMWDFTSSGFNWGESNPVGDPNRFRVGPVRREPNFGVIEIAWGDTPETTQLSMIGYGERGQMLTRQSVWLSELRFPARR